MFQLILVPFYTQFLDWLQIVSIFLNRPLILAEWLVGFMAFGASALNFLLDLVSNDAIWYRTELEHPSCCFRFLYTYIIHDCFQQIATSPIKMSALDRVSSAASASKSPDRHLLLPYGHLLPLVIIVRSAAPMCGCLSPKWKCSRKETSCWNMCVFILQNS